MLINNSEQYHCVQCVNIEYYYRENAFTIISERLVFFFLFTTDYIIILNKVTLMYSHIIIISMINTMLHSTVKKIRSICQGFIVIK